MSFDRMIEWVDEWAMAENRDDVVAQIGPSDFEPRTVKVLPFMAPPEYRERMASADAIQEMTPEPVWWPNQVVDEIASFWFGDS